ncbi:MAG: Sec-independent protein translocase protein TatB [Paracoccaceae bacterium]
MFEIGWTELLVIGVVALIVIGPRDLPAMFQQLGRFTAKMRTMARDFQRAMDQAANETGINDVARDLKAAGSIKSTGLNAMKDAAAKFEKWDPIKNAARPTTAATTAPVAATAATAAAATPAPALGPEVQALRDAQLKRQAIIAETTERLRAVATTPAPVVIEPVAETSEPAKPARKPRVKAAAPADPEKPKKPRKTAAKSDTKAPKT